MAGDIYQEIWDADQGASGVRAVRPGEQGPDGGHVVVDEKGDATTEHTLLPEVRIPDAKMESYRRVAGLFNNFTLDQTKRENDLPEEQAEVQAFLEAIHASPPMEVAREYAARQMGRALGRDEWWAMVERVWFERYDMGNNRDLTGFEHTMAGEQKQGAVSGYHFWYKYYLDEHFQVPGGGGADLIDFKAWKHGAEATPDVVTLSYVWRAFDYEAQKFRNLTKPIGGFWVGPSAEGIMAMGTIRFLNDVHAPTQAVINGHRYTLKVHAGVPGRTLRSFYPEYVGPEAPVDAAPAEGFAPASLKGLAPSAGPRASIVARSGLYEVDLETGVLTPLR